MSVFYGVQYSVIILADFVAVFDCVSNPLFAVKPVVTLAESIKVGSKIFFEKTGATQIKYTFEFAAVAATLNK